MSDTNDAIAAFLARGGKVEKVRTGASNGMTARDWYNAVRDPAPVKRVLDDGLDEAVSERQHEIACAYGTEGLNEFNIGLAKHGARAMVGWSK